MAETVSLPASVEATAAPRPPLTLYHLIMFLDTSTALSRQLTRHLQSALEESITTPPEQTAIDIWIESTGGDAHATYKLFLELRSRCSRLRAIVPDYAKSAATLLVMGTDKIFMAAAAELGPLDVQIEHPDREGVIISGLEASGSLEFITKTAFSMAISGGASLVKYTELPRSVVLQDTLKFIAHFFQPIVSKFDPHLVSQASKQLLVAERYATTMLKKRVLPPSRQMGAEDTKKLLKRLVKDYPVHEFIISRDEARELGLPVVRAEAHPRWSSLKAIYDTPRENGSSAICILTDAEIEEAENNSRADTASEASHDQTNLHQPSGNGGHEPHGANDESATSNTVSELARATTGGGDGVNA